jgi:hypothetical protein
MTSVEKKHMDFYDDTTAGRRAGRVILPLEQAHGFYFISPRFIEG